MLILLVAYLGGVLTIVSPCILPVLPFVFARADRPFLRGGLPMLAGLAITFAAVATLAAVGGGWAVQANQAGRNAALALLAAFGLTLLLPGLADRLTQPLVRLGDRLTRSLDRGDGAGSILPSLLLGMATGLLWAPCAGPILGLILTGAALRGANAMTSFLLLAYAAGAATSLALALLVGGRVFVAMKRSLGAGQWVRRGLGAAVLAGVAAIAMGWDTTVLAGASQAGTARIEQGLLDRLRPAGGDARTVPAAAAVDLPDEGAAPPLDGVTAWLNTPPLTMAALKGRVVLIDFWTYSCINCLRTLPYTEAWAAKYKDAGLVVIGVHTPEFAFEKSVDNIRQALGKLGVAYPVAVDDDYAVWRAYHNEYWPAHYFVDASGRIRHHHFGEGGYAESEQVIQQLLAEAGHPVADGPVAAAGRGAQAAPDERDIDSPETYVGYARAANFASPGGARPDAAATYAGPTLRLNQWALIGDWTVGAEHATLAKPGGAIAYRFHARDLHLVMGPAADGTPVRFRATLDGKPPGDDHGADTDANGYGLVGGQRLYQLIRQGGKVDDRLFEIRFLDPGAQAFAFTFG